MLVVVKVLHAKNVTTVNRNRWEAAENDKYGDYQLNGSKVIDFVNFQDGGRRHLGFYENVMFDQLVVKNVTAATFPSNMVTIGWTVQKL